MAWGGSESWQDAAVAVTPSVLTPDADDSVSAHLLGARLPTPLPLTMLLQLLTPDNTSYGPSLGPGAMLSSSAEVNLVAPTALLHHWVRVALPAACTSQAYLQRPTVTQLSLLPFSRQKLLLRYPFRQ